MIVPILSARIEERHDLIAQRIDRSQVRAFVAIADRAGKRQVIFHGSPAVLARYHMVYRMCFRSVILMDQAVFATIVRAVNNHAS